MNNKVFITQALRNLNFTEAADYGEVVFLTSREFKPEPTIEQFNDEVIHEIKRNFSSYLMGVDFIVLTGSSIPNVVVGSLLQSGAHKILKWNNRSSRYELFILKV